MQNDIENQFIAYGWQKVIYNNHNNNNNNYNNNNNHNNNNNVVISSFRFADHIIDVERYNASTVNVTVPINDVVYKTQFQIIDQDTSELLTYLALHLRRLSGQI
jgi:hypothetical protein